MKKKNIFELKRAGICCEEEIEKKYKSLPLPPEAIEYINKLPTKTS